MANSLWLNSKGEIIKCNNEIFALSDSCPCKHRYRIDIELYRGAYCLYKRDMSFGVKPVSYAGGFSLTATYRFVVTFPQGHLPSNLQAYLVPKDEDWGSDAFTSAQLAAVCYTSTITTTITGNTLEVIVVLTKNSLFYDPDILFDLYIDFDASSSGGSWYNKNQVSFSSPVITTGNRFSELREIVVDRGGSGAYRYATYSNLLLSTSAVYNDLPAWFVMSGTNGYLLFGAPSTIRVGTMVSRVADMNDPASFDVTQVNVPAFEHYNVPYPVRFVATANNRAFIPFSGDTVITKRGATLDVYSEAGEVVSTGSVGSHAYTYSKLDPWSTEIVERDEGVIITNTDLTTEVDTPFVYDYSDITEEFE